MERRVRSFRLYNRRSALTFNELAATPFGWTRLRCGECCPSTTQKNLPLVRTDPRVWSGKLTLLSTVGATSEAADQVSAFGRMAFGGAGIFVTEKLMRDMEANYAECWERWRNLFGGDEMVTRCAALAKGPEWTKSTVTVEERGLHRALTFFCSCHWRSSADAASRRIRHTRRRDGCVPGRPAAAQLASLP